MNRKHRCTYPLMGACLTLVVAAACASDAGTNPSSGVGEVAITLARTNVTAAPAGVPPAGASEAQAALDFDNVSSLAVEILAVQVRRVDSDSDDGEPPTDENGEEGEDEGDGNGEWITLELDPPVVIDFLAVPVEGEDPPLVIAAGVLEAGDYNGLRLITGDATITFIEPFSVGQSTFEGEHAVMIPSGAETGLKAQVTFTVTGDEGDDVNVIGILFDQGATIGNAVATGSGKVIVTPVLR